MEYSIGLVFIALALIRKIIKTILIVIFLVLIMTGIAIALSSGGTSNGKTEKEENAAETKDK